MFQILKRYFTEKVQNTIVFKYKGNKPKTLTFVSSEILNWVHTTYSVNILKIEYLPKSAPTAANILTLLVWR
jgi:hypothetical protein